MTKTSNFETTAQYVTEIINLLAEPQRITENHSLTALHVPENNDDKVFSIHTSLEIPRRPDFDPQRMKRYGDRSLRVIILGAAITRDEFEQIPDVIGINSSYQYILGNDTTTVNPVLGKLWYHFNTKRLLEYGSTVFREGYHRGIQEDEDVQEFVLDELGIPRRSRGNNAHRYLAEIVEDESLINGISEIRASSTIDFTAVAREVARESGVPAPQSLAKTPGVTVDSRGPLAVGPNEPYMTSVQLAIDDYDVKLHERSLAEMTVDSHEGYEPGQDIQEGYLFYKKYTREDSTPLGIGINVSQWKSSGEGRREAEDGPEARRMLTPLIQSMTNLRRYANKAYSNLS